MASEKEKRPIAAAPRVPEVQEPVLESGEETHPMTAKKGQSRLRSLRKPVIFADVATHYTDGGGAWTCLEHVDDAVSFKEVSFQCPSGQGIPCEVCHGHAPAKIIRAVLSEIKTAGIEFGKRVGLEWYEK